MRAKVSWEHKLAFITGLLVVAHAGLMAWGAVASYLGGLHGWSGHALIGALFGCVFYALLGWGVTVSAFLDGERERDGPNVWGN